MATRAILIVVMALITFVLVHAHTAAQKDVLLVGELHGFDQLKVKDYEEEAMHGKICLAVERGEKSYGAEKPLDGKPNVYGLEELNVYALTVSGLAHIEAINRKSNFSVYRWAIGIERNPLRRAAWSHMKRPFSDPNEEQLALTVDKWDHSEEELNTYHYLSAIRVNHQLSIALLDMLEKNGQLSNFHPDHQSLFKKAFLMSKHSRVHDRFTSEVATDLRNQMFANVICPLYEQCNAPMKVVIGYEHVIGLKALLEERLPGVNVSVECLPKAREKACEKKHPLCELCN